MAGKVLWGLQVFYRDSGLRIKYISPGFPNLFKIQHGLQAEALRHAVAIWDNAPVFRIHLAAEGCSN